MNRINQLARMGSLRSAMDEAYDAVQQAPTYLPLHTLMGDLLVQDGRNGDAITKYSVVAHAYGVRGEVMPATKLLRRIIQISPMDMGARNRLIDLLVARGHVDEAINEYRNSPPSTTASPNWTWRARPTPPPCAWYSRATPAATGIPTSSSAWRILTCGGSTGNKPCASTSRSAPSRPTTTPPANNSSN
ncbi:MAG: tetratricopeptide repeat protein [Chloroflexi bacterium]|nr:tetratricopeptide repeat protein [Chloroflexota bacterium]